MRRSLLAAFAALALGSAGAAAADDPPGAQHSGAAPAPHVAPTAQPSGSGGSGNAAGDPLGTGDTVDTRARSDGTHRVNDPNGEPLGTGDTADTKARASDRDRR